MENLTQDRRPKPCTNLHFQPRCWCVITACKRSLPRLFLQVSVCLWGSVCPLPRRPPCQGDPLRPPCQGDPLTDLPARETPHQGEPPHQGDPLPRRHPPPGRPPHRPPCQGDPLTDLPARETPHTRETPCQGDTPHQGDPPVKETPSRPTPRGEIEGGGQVQAHTQGGNWGGSDPGPHPRGELRGIRFRPTPKGEIKGDQIQAHTQGGNWGGSNPGPHPRGKFRGSGPDTPRLKTIIL